MALWPQLRSPRFALLALTLAFCLVRARDQPGVDITLGGTVVTVVPGDLLLAALAVTSIAVLARRGVERETWGALAAAVVFCALVLGTAAFNGTAALVSAVKLVELSALGLGAFALTRSRPRLEALVDILLLFTIAADLVGLVKFVEGGGGRQASFLGEHDFAALATLPLVYGLARSYERRPDARAWIAIVAGAAGCILGAAVASLAGLYVGALVLVVGTALRRRANLRALGITVVVVGIVTAGTLSIRAGDLGFLQQWFGKPPTRPGQYAASWSQRLIYVYVGGRIFLAQPVLGTGWYGDLPPKEFVAYLPAARRRFADQPANYFPPADRSFIPQQTWDQILYELGAAGALAMLALLVALVRRVPARSAPLPRSALRPAGRLGGGDHRGTRRRRLLRRDAARRDVLAGRRPDGRDPALRRGFGQVKIVHVIARLNVGGAALSVLELAAEQQRRGNDVLVVAGTIPQGEASMEHLAATLGVPYLRLPELKRELSPRDDLAATRKLRTLIRRRRPDVLHTHTAKAGTTGRIAAVLSGRARPRVVHTFHGHVLTGYFDARRERFFQLLERALAHVTDRIVAVSDQVRDDLIRLRIAPAAKVTVVQYGFDLDARTRRRRRPQASGERLGDFVIGWAGRLSEIKRPLDLVRVTAKVPGSRLVLAGDGELRADVERLVGELALTDRVQLLGYVDDLGSRYRSFDAFLLTSANEGAPVVAIEAQAAGVPVVATDAGGTRNVVDDGETGFLAPIGAIDELAELLTRLRDDPDLRARLGATGAARMRERFSTARMADDLDVVYAEILAR